MLHKDETETIWKDDKNRKKKMMNIESKLIESATDLLSLVKK